MVATAAGKALGMYLGIPAPFTLAFVAIPPALVFSWLQAGVAAQMIGNAFPRTPEDIVPVA
jgi:hypothetical protein